MDTCIVYIILWTIGIKVPIKTLHSSVSLHYHNFIVWKVQVRLTSVSGYTPKRVASYYIRAVGDGEAREAIIFWQSGMENFIVTLIISHYSG